MKTTHYTRTGYNGDFTFNAICGKVVNPHKQENHDITVYPEKANCKKCLNTKEHSIDLNESTSINIVIKRRIFIESDIVQCQDLERAKDAVLDYTGQNKLKCVDNVFSRVLDRAWYDLENTWNEVKKADEIWAVSSLVPLCGDSSMGAPVIFNGMCKRAINECVVGKSVFILSSVENISWNWINLDLMKKAFEQNSFFACDKEYRNLIKIDVSKIKK